MPITRFAGLIPVLIIATCAGCASLGETPADKRQAVLEMRDQTLARLYREKPGARERISEAAGWGVFDAASQNLILLQTGGGYGVLADGEELNPVLRDSVAGRDSGSAEESDEESKLVSAGDK